MTPEGRPSKEEKVRTLLMECDSDRSLIAAQPDRCGEEGRGDCQADPQTRAAQEMTRSEVRHRIHREGARR